MPLTAFQRELLQVLAQRRQPESHLAGGTLINRSSLSPRFSADIDLFHDSTDAIRANAEADVAALIQQGCEIEWLQQQPTLQRARVQRGLEQLKVEWCYDSAFRFFPVSPDFEFGYCLHPADLATNKALALAGRAEIRDFIDILYLHRTYLSLGATCWAACGKDQGYTPWSLLESARRHMKFREEDLAREHLVQPIPLVDLKKNWLTAAQEAEVLFGRLPLAEVGCLYLNPSLAPVTPDTADPDFKSLIRHFGSIQGSFPSAPP